MKINLISFIKHKNSKQLIKRDYKNTKEIEKKHDT